MFYTYFDLNPYNKRDFFLVQIDSDKTVMVTFKHDDKLPENVECGFQVIMRWNECLFLQLCVCLFFGLG